MNLEQAIKYINEERAMLPCYKPEERESRFLATVRAGLLAYGQNRWDAAVETIKKRGQ